MHDAEIQRAYYARTASTYENLHVHEDDGHTFALNLMLGATDFLGVRSVLDIGSGTGRAVSAMKRMRPALNVVGIEPVKELRSVGYSNGLTDSELRDGNALGLDFQDGAFDLVCEFGVLHHIRPTAKVVAEMLRVAKKAVFISDNNNFGQGSLISRTLKQAINAIGLWPIADFIKTRGRGYMISEGDGLAYSYSVFNDYEQIARQCSRVHVLNIEGDGRSAYKSAPGVALLGIK